MRTAIQSCVLFFVLCTFSSCSFEPSAILKQQTQPVVGGDKDDRFPGIVNIYGTFQEALVGSWERHQLCTGILIRSNVVLTAGHCIHDFATLKKQVLEELGYKKFLPRIEVTVGGKSFSYEITSFHKHPNYKKSTQGYDFGLLVLSKDVEETKPMELYQGKFQESWFKQKALALGYGLLSNVGTRVPAKRKYSIESSMEEVHRSIVPLSARNLLVRMYTKGKALCLGDSGAGILFKVGGRYQVIGVHSWSVSDRAGAWGVTHNCTGHNFFGRIEVGMPWIKQVLSQQTQRSCSSSGDCGSCFLCTSGICQHACEVGEYCDTTQGTSHICKELSFCGDGICGRDENCSSCQADCGCESDQFCNKRQLCEARTRCGNGTCDVGEDCHSCPGDCGCKDGKTCSKQGVCEGKKSCGDGVCDTAVGETCGSCYVDCSCKDSQVCQKDICVDDKVKKPSETIKEPVVEKLPCPMDEQLTRCDAQGKNCKDTCAETKGQGCSTGGSAPIQGWLVLLVLLTLLSSKRKRTPLR